jgi:hypothetical protein
MAVRIRRNAPNSALINGAIFVSGLAVSLGTLASATRSGGAYFIFWGAIVFGLYGCVRALVRYAQADGEAAVLMAMHVGRSSQNPMAR